MHRESEELAARRSREISFLELGRHRCDGRKVRQQELQRLAFRLDVPRKSSIMPPVIFSPRRSRYRPPFAQHAVHGVGFDSDTARSHESVLVSRDGVGMRRQDVYDVTHRGGASLGGVQWKLRDHLLELELHEWLSVVKDLANGIRPVFCDDLGRVSPMRQRSY